jgi:uncharacterized membrane protein
MTPQEGFDNTVTTSPDATPNAALAKMASAIVLLAGLWYFFSPWIYGVSDVRSNSWNSWIVGGLVFIFGCIRATRTPNTIALSWINALLGAWAFFSPWIFGYTNETARFANSLCIGVVVFVLAIISARASRLIPHVGVNASLRHQS